MDLMTRRRALMAQAQKLIVLATATGNPMTFTTDLVKRLHSLVIPFTPIQAAGTPSPDNPLPISGWTGANIGQSGKNLFDLTATKFAIGYSVYLKPNGSHDSSGSVQNGTVILNWGNNSAGIWFLLGSVIANKQYTISLNKLNTAYRWKIATLSVDEITAEYPFSAKAVEEFGGFSGAEVNKTITPTKDGYLWINCFLGATGTDGATNIQVEFGNAKTNYVPFVGVNTFPINWQSEAGTIYGGTVTLNEDGSADVVVTMSSVNLGDLVWNTYSGTFYATLDDRKYADVAFRDNTICEQYSYWRSAGSVSNLPNGMYRFRADTDKRIYFKNESCADAAAFKLAVAGVKLVYELAIPQTYHIPNAGSLTIYLGTNNIWTDTNGTNTAEYWIKNT